MGEFIGATTVLYVMLPNSDSVLQVAPSRINAYARHTITKRVNKS